MLSVFEHTQAWYAPEVFDISREKRRIVENGRGRNKQIHCCNRSACALDSGEQPSIGRRESRVGVRDDQAGEQTVEFFVFLERPSHHLRSSPELAHNVNRDAQDFIVVEQLERIECRSRALAQHFPEQIDQQGTVEVNHRRTALAEWRRLART